MLASVSEACHEPRVHRSLCEVNSASQAERAERHKVCAGSMRHGEASVPVDDPMVALLAVIGSFGEDELENGVSVRVRQTRRDREHEARSQLGEIGRASCRERVYGLV